MSLYPSSSTSGRWFALLGWPVVVFTFSTDSFSSAETSRILGPALKYLFPSLAPEQLEFLHLVCRKAGHILEYFVLGVLAWRALRADMSQNRTLRVRVLAAGFVVAVAFSDEFHQFFVPSRTSSLVDVGYD